jgi:hypothetical protein
VSIIMCVYLVFLIPSFCSGPISGHRLIAAISGVHGACNGLWVHSGPTNTSFFQVAEVSNV